MKRHYSQLLTILAFGVCSCNTDTVTITYNGNSAEVSSNNEDIITTKIDGANVTIHNDSKDKELSFVLKGTSGNGSFTLKSDHKAKVVFHNLNLTSNEGAAIHIKNKSEVKCVVADNTDNTITITACEDTAKHKASALHAKHKVKFMGHGTLNVIATGKGCKGINVKKDLTIEDVNLNVSTSGMYLSEDTTHHDFPPFDPDNMPEEMKKHFDEMRKKFEEMAKNGELPPFPGMPGAGAPMGPPMGMPGAMHPMGMGAPAGPPMGGGAPFMKHKYIGKAKAIKCNEQIIINSGNVTVNTCTPGAEGIEGKEGIIINGGTVYSKANDDAINSNAQIFFNGGKVTAISTNNDAVDVNLEGGFPPMFGFEDNDNAKKDMKSAIIINGGEVYAWSQTGAPEEGLDCDFSPIEISGGTVFSIGAGMGEMPSVPTAKTAKQPTVLVLGLNIKANQVIEVYEADSKDKPTGEALISITPTFDFNNSSSIITSPAFKVGKKYVIKSGSTTRLFEQKEGFTVCR